MVYLNIEWGQMGHLLLISYIRILKLNVFTLGKLLKVDLLLNKTNAFDLLARVEHVGLILFVLVLRIIQTSACAHVLWLCIIAQKPATMGS